MRHVEFCGELSDDLSDVAKVCADIKKDRRRRHAALSIDESRYDELSFRFSDWLNDIGSTSTVPFDFKFRWVTVAIGSNTLHGSNAEDTYEKIYVIDLAKETDLKMMIRTAFTPYYADAYYAIDLERSTDNHLVIEIVC